MSISIFMIILISRIDHSKNIQRILYYIILTIIIIVIKNN